MSADTATMRCLVACEDCRRQYDASGLAQGSLFRCSCGEIIKVPHFMPQDAAVVRCSSCSAPRTKGSLSCEHCGADYTLHERDLQTICPSCMTRVSDRARYCHYCAVPITPAGAAGNTTKLPCPSCGRRAKLNDRTLGDPPVTVLECARCAGLFLNRKAFEIMADRARDQVLPEQLLEAKSADQTPAGSSQEPAAFYRKCPECDKHMNRRNFGGKSGVVIDICRDHGLWFDAQELGTILKWIKQGGEARARRHLETERDHSNRQDRFKVDPTANVDRDGLRKSNLIGPSEMLGRFLGSLFDL